MNNTLNLTAINEAFGNTADLYRDVLVVKANASTEQIQRAYFERRNELFQLLAELENLPDSQKAQQKRVQAERQMDAVVMTLRILGDQKLRSQYDDIRLERISAGMKNNGKSRGDKAQPTFRMRGDSTTDDDDEEGDIPMKPKSVLKKSSYHISVVQAGSFDNQSARMEQSEFTGMTNSPSRGSVSEIEPDTPDRVNTSTISFASLSPKHSQGNSGRKSKRKARRVSPDQHQERNKGHPNKKKTMDDSFISTVQESDVENESIVSEGSFRTLRTMETSLTTYEENRGYFQAIKDEVLGALDDTSQSFHQVFSVFTLREDEIDAVAGRIEKARRQMIHSFSGN